YVLFWAGSSESDGPLPVAFPTGGTIAEADGAVSKPLPGTLSNGAASCGAPGYGDGFTFTSGAGPSSFIFARVSRASGVAAAATVTPIGSGSVQPAASYGRSGGPPGYCRRSG